MAQERNEAVEEMTYEAELKALKAKWAGRRAEERKAKKVEANQEKKEASIECVKKALEALQGVHPTFNKELAPVVKRLNMFINGEKYTRNFQGGNE